MRLATAALALLAVALPASAQGRWLDTFAVPGIYGGDIDGGQVHAAVADGGGALIGGDFRTVDGTEAHGVARWTGMTWEPFGGGLRDADGTDGVAYAVARDHSGGVWVAGEFDAVVQPDGSTLSASGVARWTGDGWDVPCRLTGGMFGRPTVYAVLVVGGSVYLAGDFANLIRPGGSALGGSGVVRWTDGIWMSLGQRRQTTALAALPDGDILASGFFPGPDGEIGVGVERWNGSAWTPYTRTLGTFAIVLSLLVDEGDLYVGGLFSGGRTASNALVASRNVIRWDGQSWQPVGAGAGSIEPAGGEVRELALDGGGGLLVGGYVEVGFNADGSTVASPGLIRWTGSEWERRAISDASGQVTALGRLPEETIVGGRFALLRETGGATVRATRLAVLADEGGPRPFSARTGRDGTFFFSGSGQYVRLAPDGCGGVHVYAPEQAGPLASNGGSTSRRWSGTAWEPVPLALRQSGLFGLTADGPGPVVTVVASVPGSCDAFVVGGRFGGFVPSSGPWTYSVNVALWTGTAWQALGRGVVPGASSDDFVEAVAVQPGGAVVVGGSFNEVQQADGTTLRVNGVARWTAAGGWMALGGGLINNFSNQPRRVRALLAEADGSIIVGGRFDIADNAGATSPVFVDGVARWTGTRWEPFATDLPIEGSQVEVAALARWNGLLVVGGAFAQIRQSGGARLDARNVAAWDGTAWRALPGLTTAVSALAVVDGVLIASNGLGGQAARWTGAAWVPLAEGAPRGVVSLAAAGRRLYASGAFETAGGIGSPGLAVFDFDATSPAEASPETASGALRSYPNPARSAATLAFCLDAAGPVRLTLVDALGRTIAVLHDGELAAGEQTVRVDTSRLPAGVYVARLDAGGRVEARRITVVR